MFDPDGRLPRWPLVGSPKAVVAAARRVCVAGAGTERAVCGANGRQWHRPAIIGMYVPRSKDRTVRRDTTGLREDTVLGCDHVTHMRPKPQLCGVWPRGHRGPEGLRPRLAKPSPASPYSCLLRRQCPPGLFAVTAIRTLTANRDQCSRKWICVPHWPLGPSFIGTPWPRTRGGTPCPAVPTYTNATARDCRCRVSPADARLRLKPARCPVLC